MAESPFTTFDLATSGTNVAVAGIPVWDEGCEERISRSGQTSQATRTLVCRWGDRAALYLALLGAGTDVVNTGGAGPVYGFRAPAVYPDAPFLWCEQVDLVEGIDGSGGGRSVGPNGMIAFKYARLKATYKVPDGLEIGSLQIDYSGEVQTLPQDVPTLSWEDGTPVPSEVNAPLNIAMAKLSVTIKNLPSIPSETILGLMDHVNQDDFNGGAPGTVVYKGASSSKKFTTLGIENFDLTHCWLYRKILLADGSPGTWNHFLRPNGGGWQKVVRMDNLKPPFPAGDFTALITPVPLVG